MHAFQTYILKLDKKDKKNFLSKYHEWIADLFRALEFLIDTIDSQTSNHQLTDSEVKRLGQIFTKMYQAKIEDETESMLVAFKEMSGLNLRIWKRLNKAL